MKCSPWNPLFWLTGHCYHVIRTERKPVVCRNGVQLYEFPQVCEEYDLNRCCECGHERWIEDTGDW